MSGKALRVLLTVLGVVAIVTGLLVVIGGSGVLPGEKGAIGATAESELRFFAAFWVAFGAFALYVAPRAAVETTLLRIVALAIFAGGVGRALAWLSAGPPHPLFAILTVAELAGPPLLVAWQARLAR